MVGTLGLALFLYAVGIQYGKQFVLGLTSAAGRRANLIALVGVLSAGVVSLLIAGAMGLNLGYALGLFAGSGTQHADAAGSDRDARQRRPGGRLFGLLPVRRGRADPVLYFAFMFLKPEIDATPSARHGDARDRASQPGPLRQARSARSWPRCPAGVKIVALRTGHHNQPAAHGHVVAENDVVLVVAPDKEVLEQARRTSRRGGPGRVSEDRSDLDYLRVFASRPGVVGRPLGDLALPGDKAVVIAQVRRGDTNILPRPDLVLEFGDRVGLLAHRDDFSALRKFFGDSIKGTAEFSYVSIGLGMALGLLLGAIRIPLPGIGTLSVGLSGVLIVALILGNLRRTRRHQLDHPAVGQPRAAQPRADAVPRPGRDGVGAQVRRGGDGNRPADVRPGRARRWPRWCCRSWSSACSCIGCRSTRWRASSRAPAARRSSPTRTR